MEVDSGPGTLSVRYLDRTLVADVLYFLYKLKLITYRQLKQSNRLLRYGIYCSWFKSKTCVTKISYPI